MNEKVKIDEQDSLDITADDSVAVYNDAEDLSDLQDSDSDNDELPPPEEENKARQLNVGNILAVIFIAISVIAVIFLLFGGKKKKAEEKDELDKAGWRIEQDFTQKEKYVPPMLDEDSDAEDALSDEDIDKILSTLPPEFQQQPSPSQAPVAPIGTTSRGSASTRPDTRGSKSPRKIEGLKNLNYNNSVEQSMQNISSALQSSYGQSTSPNGMSREEYLSNAMAKIQQSGSQTAQQNREIFFQSGQGNAGSGYYMTENSLWDGTVISAALQTAINTDNPGVVVARVTENVWSSGGAKYLLIPEGSLLFATYNSSISYGQNRVQVAWNLLIRPDGYRVTLGNMNGVDKYGASGYAGTINNHNWQIIKALGLVAVYSLINTEFTSQIANSNDEYSKNAINDVYSEISKFNTKTLDRALDVQPTITIKQGTKIKLITNQPLTLPPVQINPVTKKYIRYQ